MNVRISRAVFDQILDHADRYPHEEVCGLLLGQPGSIEGAARADNVAQDRSSRFELDPATLLAAHKAARAGGPAVIGHYHSHPAGEASPSEVDAAEAQPGSLWLIVAAGRAGLFEARRDGPIHGRFQPVAYDLYQDRVAQSARRRHKGHPV